MDYADSKIKFSFVIPYKKRLDNIKLLFESLSKQTMDKDEFEVIVGAMEYCEEYVSVCNSFSENLNIHTVMSNKEWQVAYARNIALKQAVGNVIVLLDADMILGSNFLVNLFEKHFSGNQNQCIIGQMIDYDNNTSEVKSVSTKSFSYYEKKLIELERKADFESDERFKVQCNIPWAFAWTALIALPRKVIEEKKLFFDLNFKGYGVEDLEWAYRIYQTGTPILLKNDVWGIHLSHVRNINNNRKTEMINYRYFLKKWTEIDVELACTFGDFQANNNYLEFKNQLSNIIKNKDSKLCVLKGKIDGKSVLVVGGIRNISDKIENLSCFSEDDINCLNEILPIVGLSLPYEENTFDICYIMICIEDFSWKYRSIIKEECERVSRKVINLVNC